MVGGREFDGGRAKGHVTAVGNRKEEMKDIRDGRERESSGRGPMDDDSFPETTVGVPDSNTLKRPTLSS
ncbi:hypothetical protein CRG98_004688 [Punica granatum]|uniref:Uncharacterized protein n=1 Tax=Punica granatum TaxID=22663 RepID=A0A2I0L454_PUNGR|nr:hypothetical protein CRG98_004688 [Punica granatum]